MRIHRGPSSKFDSLAVNSSFCLLYLYEINIFLEKRLTKRICLVIVRNRKCFITQRMEKKMEFTRQQEIEMGNELEILDIKILHQSWNLEKSEIEKINERRDEIRKYFTEQSKLEELQMQIKSNKFVEKWKKMSNKEKLEFYKEKLSKLSKKEKYEIKFTKQDIEKYEKIVQEESIVVEVEVESEKENEVFESTVEIEKEKEKEKEKEVEYGFEWNSCLKKMVLDWTKRKSNN